MSLFAIYPLPGHSHMRLHLPSAAEDVNSLVSFVFSESTIILILNDSFFV